MIYTINLFLVILYAVFSLPLLAVNGKYEILKDQTIVVDQVTLYRIKALKDIRKGVKAGDLGGYIQSEANLKNAGKAWVGGDAKVYGDAIVSDRGLVAGKAQVYGNAKIYSRGQVLGSAKVYENAQVKEGKVIENAQVYGNAMIGAGEVGDSSKVYENAFIHGNIRGASIIKGEAKVLSWATVINSTLSQSANIKGLIAVVTDSKICNPDVIKNKVNGRDDDCK